MSITLAKTNKSTLSVIQRITVYKVELHTNGELFPQKSGRYNYESLYSFIYNWSCMIEAQKLSKCSSEKFFTM